MKNNRVVGSILGGIGNQLFAYAAAKSLAIDLGYELCLDVSYYRYFDKYGRKYKLDVLGVAEANDYKGLGMLLHIPIVRKLVSRYFDNVLIEEAIGDQLEIYPDENKSYYLRGYWQSENNFKHNRNCVLSSINLDVPLPDYAQKICMHIVESESVCIHYRNYSEVSGAHKKSIIDEGRKLSPDIDYYQKAIKAIVSENKNSKFFVFSEERFPVDMSVYDCVFVESPSGVHDSDICDLILMSHCKKFILSNSSFGWWGAWLSLSEEVFYPENRGYYHYPQPSEKWMLI